MRFQTIPSTVPESPPSTFTELAQTGAGYLVPLLLVAVALLLVGAALVWLAAQVREVRR